MLPVGGRGGLRIDEPAVGLSLVLALLSGVRDVPVDEHIVAIGEVGLAGEVRSVSQVEARIAADELEAQGDCRYFRSAEEREG